MGIIVAIDGPSGAGKSSTAKAIASRAGWNYLDTGALYRAVTWLALEYKCEEPFAILQAIKDHPIKFDADPESPHVFAGSTQITHAIRGTSVTENVSRFSAMPEIRQELLKLQHSIIDSAKRGIVVEGRDIGTVVAPEAGLKIYLTADLDARAARRESETEDKNLDVKTSLDNRDVIDSTRAVSPLTMAADAVEVDSTYLDLEETIERIWELLKKRNLLGLPIVAILGRPNVGKSTLINRFLGRREAIVEDTPGVTRDRVKYEAEWNGRRFILIDTGGWEVAPEGISEKITAGSEAAIAESDVVLFVIDAQVGALDEDESLVSLLRKSKKKVIVAANKVDGPSEETEAHALWNLGFGEPRFVSALHGRGSGDLLDFLVKELPEIGSEKSDDGFRRIALVGRPNVGKSSLLNILAGESRVIVDDAAGTTRDPVDELIDTKLASPTFDLML